ncbi:ABC transporter substrate-binding protein [Pseudonocardia sp. HH130630-07]|uniref:ABC transporter substrate-binding protein n=1 Tax=Pseudonocardia sp. HH130630-07 TaxID=1690815 RepID=UPI000814EC5A|nr:sugar ABC transporter substrate-binding protein [Pseudonocardia sp. HH130630-07]ANY07878.1 ABC transporter substrate-binding protein [Pseudonocardia sp. HH130630-07]
MIPVPPGQRRPRAPRIAAALVGALTLLLTGCAGGYVDPAPAPYERAPRDLQASISYAMWDRNQLPAIEQTIEAFHEEYPGIEVTVDITPFAQYFTKLKTQATSGVLPDVFWLNARNLELYASHGKLVPITGAVEAGDIDPAAYPRPLVDLYTHDDVRYAVPKDFDTIGLWVNKRIFERAGVPLPGPDLTWEQVRDLGVRISAALGAEGVHGVASDLGDSQSSYYNTVLQAGGEVFADGRSGLDTPAGRAGIGFWRDLITSGASPTFPQLVDSPAQERFLGGRLGMMIGGSWFRAGLSADEADDVLALPLPRGERAATVVHGLGNVVAASSPEQQAAQAFQVFLAGDRAQRILGDSGAAIPARTGTQDGFVGSLPPGANLRSFVDSLAYARPLPVGRKTDEWDAAERALLPDVFSGARTVDEVLPELAGRVDEILAEQAAEAADE